MLYICGEGVRLKICFKGKSNTTVGALDWRSKERGETRIIPVFDLNSCVNIDDVYWDMKLGDHQFGGVKKKINSSVGQLIGVRCQSDIQEEMGEVNCQASLEVMWEVKGRDIHFSIVNLGFLFTVMGLADNSSELKVYLKKREKDWPLVHSTP